MSSSLSGQSGPLLFHGPDSQNKRLSVQQCRKALGSTCALTDSQIEQLRDQMYMLADVALDAFQQVRIASNSASLAERAA